MKTQILRVVSIANGINSMHLALKVMEIIGPARFNTEMFDVFLNELVHNKELIELKFFHEDSCILGYNGKDNGIAYLYFKKGTQIL